MKCLYCIKSEKYTEFKNLKISCICDEKLFFLLFVTNVAAITIKHFKENNLNDINNVTE